MAQNDIFPGLSVDAILSDVKEQQGAKMKLWSLEDIDKLLAEEDEDSAPVPQSTEVRAPSATEPTAVEEVVRLPHAEETVQPQTQSAPASGPSLKAAARRAAQHIEPNAADAHFAPSADEILPVATQSEISEPFAPLLEGVTPQTPSEPTGEVPTQAPENPIPGQISMEKTRVFNEVEAHAVHSAEIEHRIGNPILRTTTGELDPLPKPKKRAGMETDAQRERFLNRPEQKLEKTMEHKELLSKLPPKTIERPGVIVRKAAGQTTGTDGLQAIPTLILPEDELKAQKEAETRVQAGTLKSMAHEAMDEENVPLDDQMMLEGFDTEEEPIAYIDEAEAELSLLERRREKAKKFRLFPGLENEQVQDLPQTDETVLPEADLDTGKTRVQPDYAEIEPQLPEEDGEAPTDLEKEDEETEDVPVQKSRRREKSAEAPITVLREFYGPKDAQAVYDIYLSEKRGSDIRLIVFIILTLAAVAAALSVRLTGDFGLFNGNPSVYSSVNLVFLVLAALLSLKELKYAVSGILSGRTDAQTGLLCALLFGLIQVGASYAFPERLTAVPLYTTVSLFVFTLYFAGRKRKLKNDICNFETVARGHNRFYEIGKIEDAETAFEIGRGLLLGDPDVRYAKRISFPSRFVETAKRSDSALQVYALSLPVVLIAAGVVGAITCFTSGDAFTGVSAMCAVVLAGMPMSAGLVAATVLRGTNRGLLHEGALISGFDAALDVTTANAVVLDAAELFDAVNCRLRGMKIYHKMRVDEALLYTAAMTIQSGGTLSAVFEGVIQHKHEMLPQVESLAYEERLGCSGWIYNQRVLVGSRDLLIKHNVDAPTREEEQRFLRDGCEVLYLAVEGKTAALFVVEYAANERLTAYLQSLEKYGISILVRTTDPNITEGLVEQYFDLPHNLVKIINPVAGAMFRELAEKEPQPADCGILHNGRAPTFLRAFLSAFLLEEKYKLAQILLYVGVGLSITMLSVLSFFTGLRQAGAFEVLVFELLWTAIAVLLPKAKKV